MESELPAKELQHMAAGVASSPHIGQVLDTTMRADDAARLATVIHYRYAAEQWFRYETPFGCLRLETGTAGPGRNMYHAASAALYKSPRTPVSVRILRDAAGTLRWYLEAI